MQRTLCIKNNEPFLKKEIPIHTYPVFYEIAVQLCKNEGARVVQYVATTNHSPFELIAVLAKDDNQELYILGHIVDTRHTLALESLTADLPSFHIFERLLYEQCRLDFMGHPWLKGVRFSIADSSDDVVYTKYPFYTLNATETHQVGVGPIHAGVIEPGHFRFTCYGEQVLHLDIQLGYQHRGIEALMLNKKHFLHQTILCEQIAGDTTVAHTWAYVMGIEALLDIQVGKRVEEIRTLALEIERMACHVGSLAGLCADIGYQLGSSVLGALRTPLINFFQTWCGNRFAKGSMRVGYAPYEYDRNLHEKLAAVLSDFDFRYNEFSEKMFSFPGVLNRLEKTSALSLGQARELGIVGLSAKASGYALDVRTSHPTGMYRKIKYETVTCTEGDAWARAKMRDLEIKKSLLYVRTLMTQFFSENNPMPRYDYTLYSKKLKKDAVCVSLVESWRGEVCHIVGTDSQGDIQWYKIKDPSLQNWFGLSIAMRNNEISDFPICNKSFDLSYCGHDL